MTLGDIIRDYRAAHNLSMDKFSEISGISKGYISMLEKNKTARGDEPSPSFEMFKSVAKTIGMEVDDLIRTVEGKISFSTDVEKSPGNISITEAEDLMLQLFRQIPEEKQPLAIDLLRTALKLK